MEKVNRYLSVCALNACVWECEICKNMWPWCPHWAAKISSSSFPRTPEHIVVIHKVVLFWGQNMQSIARMQIWNVPQKLAWTHWTALIQQVLLSQQQNVDYMVELQWDTKLYYHILFWHLFGQFWNHGTKVMVTLCHLLQTEWRVDRGSQDVSFHCQHHGR